MNIAHFLLRAARTFPDRPAISVGSGVWMNYRDFAGRAARLGAAFRKSLGLVPGDCVALAMGNCPQYLEILYAAWHAGLVVVPMNAKLHPKEFEFILKDSTSKACFASTDLAQSLETLRGNLPVLERVIEVPSTDYAELAKTDAASSMTAVQPDDVAWLFYTSGTTGRPKGVMITHRNILSMSLAYFAAVDHIAPEDCVLHAAPMSHGSGMYNFPHVLAGANQVIPESGHFDPAEIFSLGERWRGVAMFAAPTMVHRLVSHARKHAPPLDGLKTIVYGGGPMYVQDIKAALEVMGQRFAQIYGQGESPMTITALSKFHLADSGHPRHEDRLASVGTAQPPVEVIVADDNDIELPPGEIGEILVRGDTVMRGYWRNPEATRETLRNGWLHTGDVGSMDGDGFLTLRDRSKDMIISGGSNIYPREVEEILLRHPAVSEVSVVGRPHPEWGEEVIAFVVVRERARVQEKELDALCLDHIARFKRPKGYRFVAELPKNNYGKVLKTALRETFKSDPVENQPQ
ncbi:MAG TPA: AMP-binding protein [Burkholderiales bacterium]|nr:AMP-binding protein [Burkholderiales bacterium]